MVAAAQACSSWFHAEGLFAPGSDTEVAGAVCRSAMLLMMVQNRVLIPFK